MIDAMSTPRVAAPVAERKPRVVYGAFEAGVSAQPPASTSDDENVILKLSFAETASSVQPDGYDIASTSKRCDLLSGASEFVPAVEDACVRSASSVVAGGGCVSSPSGLKVIRLLTEFEEKSKCGEWPSGTCVHCYWCCHRFNNAPFGLPVKFANDQFHVVGCFCSLECAAAYNFGGKDSVDECLNRYTLINTLAFRMGLGRSIRPAPNKVALAMFGGHLSIDEFRQLSSSNKHILVNSPPMLTVTQQVEEVHETDMRSEYKYIPIDNERVVRYQEKMRLKRVKPLINFKNTLDHSMKLKYTPV